MKIKPKHKLKSAVLAFVIVTSIWLTLLFGMYSFFVPGAMNGTQTASASTPYGILGQPAPELNLNIWIDGNGKRREPIRLSDYRGKAVYLYFFQNW